MRISFSGTANSGKTTLLKSFLYSWKSFFTPQLTYRDIIKERSLTHSSSSTTETQTAILDFMVEQLGQAKKDDNIAFDRCPLDALAYTLWCHSKGIEGFDERYTYSQIKQVKESMRNLDIIFLCKFDTEREVVDDGLRDAKREYIIEIDNIFETLYQQYYQNGEADVFFPKDDMPCIIPLPHDMQARINTIASYIDLDGKLVEEPSVLSSESLLSIEQLYAQQNSAYESEKKEKELFRKFGLY